VTVGVPHAGETLTLCTTSGLGTLSQDGCRLRSGRKAEVDGVREGLPAADRGVADDLLQVEAVALWVPRLDYVLCPRASACDSKPCKQTPDGCGAEEGIPHCCTDMAVEHAPSLAFPRGVGCGSWGEDNGCVSSGASQPRRLGKRQGSCALYQHKATNVPAVPMHLCTGDIVAGRTPSPPSCQGACTRPDAKFGSATTPIQGGICRSANLHAHKKRAAIRLDGCPLSSVRDVIAPRVAALSAHRRLSEVAGCNCLLANLLCSCRRCYGRTASNPTQLSAGTCRAGRRARP
jgi:hypothetical protein